MIKAIVFVSFAEVSSDTKSGESALSTFSMSVSMKDLDPAFRGAGQKEYPFCLVSLHHRFPCGLSTCSY
jgi:hypothetical protein